MPVQQCNYSNTHYSEKKTGMKQNGLHNNSNDKTLNWFLHLFGIFYPAMKNSRPHFMIVPIAVTAKMSEQSIRLDPLLQYLIKEI
jgi:hypothetical protein